MMIIKKLNKKRLSSKQCKMAEGKENDDNREQMMMI
jgi:hypothetical protein